MEWADIPYSPLDESLYSLLSPPLEMPMPEWNSEENIIFENALAEFDPLSPTFFEDISTRVPWRSVDEIRLHYQDLVQDLEMIENGDYPIPDYPTPPPTPLEAQEPQPPPPPPPPPQEIIAMEVDMGTRRPRAEPPNEGRSTRHGQPRRRGVPWTEEEHQLFLMGLNKYGKGDWRSISRYYVITKTPTQVASHAQKYFRRQMSSTPVDRRRPSIHDIHTVNPVAPAFNPAPSFPLQFHHQPQQQLPFQPRALIPNLPQFHHGFNAQVLDQNAGFMQPFNNNGVFNQMLPPPASSYAASSSSSAPYYLPPLRNQNQNQNQHQHWGGYM